MKGKKDQEKDWFVTAFGRLYPILYAHRDDASAVQEAASMVRILGLEDRSATILDVCCGSGRHAAALAGMGFEVLGFDLSPSLLGEARARGELEGRLARADIRALPFLSAFDVVINLFTSFGYFDTEEENRGALAEMARVLVPGGRLVLDHMNRSAVIKNLVSEDRKEANGFTIEQLRRIEGDRVIKEITVSGEAGEEIRWTENVRFYTPAEIEVLFMEQGLNEVRLYGAFNGEALCEGSERMIAIGRKG